MNKSATNNQVIADLSRTQRITLKRNAQSVTIQKEWRKSNGNSWMVGKGIEVPNVCIPDLIESLDNSSQTR